MASKIIQCKKIIIKMRKLILSSFKTAGIFLFFWSAACSVEAQEYATDRLFMKEFKKTKCLSLTEDKIKNMKIIRVITLEQEALLNQNVWSKLRLNLPLSPGEKKHLRKLKQKGVYSNKLSSKNIWAGKAAKFNALRLKCK